MTNRRDRPYVQFDFLIAPDEGGESEPVAGFRECSNIGMEVTVAEYRRAGNRQAAVRALATHGEAGDATLKYGMIRPGVLRGWLGDGAGSGSRRTVLVMLRDTHDSETLLTWRLVGARIIKHVAGPLNAKATDVAMEELTLAYERIEMEF